MKLLNIQNSLYLLKRKFKVAEVEKPNELKEKLHCEKVFKKDGYYFFCNEVEEAEVEYYELCSEKEITKLVKEYATTEKLEIKDVVDEDIEKKLNEKQNINNEMLKYVLSKLKGEQHEIQKIS